MHVPVRSQSLRILLIEAMTLALHRMRLPICMDSLAKLQDWSRWFQFQTRLSHVGGMSNGPITQLSVSCSCEWNIINHHGCKGKQAFMTNNKSGELEISTQVGDASDRHVAVQALCCCVGDAQIGPWMDVLQVKVLCR